MHLWMQLQSSFLQIYSRKKPFFITLVLLIVSFLVVDYALMLLLPTWGNKAMLSQTLSRDIKDIYCLNMWKYFFPGYNVKEDICSLLKDVENLEQVEGAGVFFYTDTANTIVDQDLLVISSELLPMTELRDTEENRIDLSPQEDIYPAAVGYDLRNRYPIGSVIHDIEEERDYVVRYILKKNSRFMTEDIGDGLCANLDVRIVVDAQTYLEKNLYALDNALTTAGLCFFVYPQTDIAGIKQQINECAAAYKLDVYDIKSISEKASISLAECWNDKELFLMPLLLLIMAIIATMVSSMIAIYTRKRTVGILYAAGYFKKDIKMMYVMENAIKLGIAFSVSMAYWSVAQRNFFSMDAGSFVIRQVFFVSLGITLIMLIIGSILPLKLLDKIPIAQIIMEESE